MKMALSRAPVRDEVKGREAGLFTFFQEIRNLLLTKPSDCRNVTIMSEKGEDVVCENIGICVGSEGIVSYAPIHTVPSVPSSLRPCRYTHVSSSLLTIHVFSCGDSASENSILATSNDIVAICCGAVV